MNFIRYLLIQLTHKLAGFLLSVGIILARYEDAFGHQAWNLEYFSRIFFQEFGKYPKIIAFQKSNFIPNHFLFEHHKKSGILIVSPDNFLTRLFRSARRDLSSQATPPICSKFIYCRFTMNDLHTDPRADSSPTAFQLDSTDLTRSADVLQGMNLTVHRYFCFQDRNTLYKEKIADQMSPKFSRASNFDLARNTPLKDMFPGIDTMKTLGIDAVRLGSTPRNPSNHPTLIDYASTPNEANRFFDIALMNSCKFFVGPNSGIWLLARSLNKPVCLVNVFPWPWINVPLPPNNLVMPKKLWLKSTKRFMTIQEMVSLEKRFKWKYFYHDTSFEEQDIEVINNTPEEIKHALLEMDQRHDKSWVGSNYNVSTYLSKENIAYQTEALFPTFFVEANPSVFPQ